MDVLRWMVAGCLAVVCSLPAQTPAPGSVGLTVKNSGAGSTTQWLAPQAGKLLGFDTQGALRVVPAVGAVSWGDLEGTLSAQTDLWTVLQAKAGVESPVFTGVPQSDVWQVVSGSWVTTYGSDGVVARYDDGEGVTLDWQLVMPEPAVSGAVHMELPQVSGTLLTDGAVYGDPAWLGSLSWSKLTGVPTTFNPAAHGHLIGEVSGLQTALDSKLGVSAAGDMYQPLNAGLSQMAGVEAQKGALIAGGVSGWSLLEMGEVGQVLLVDGTAAAGMRWAEPPGNMRMSVYDPRGLQHVSGASREGVLGGVLNLDAGELSSNMLAGAGGSVLLQGGQPASLDAESGVGGGDGGTLDMRGEDAPDGANSGRPAGSLSTRGTGKLELGYVGVRTTVEGRAEADWTLKLPPGPGTTGQLLMTDGAGNADWANAPETGAKPVGTGTELQYRVDADTLGGLGGSAVDGANLSLGGALTLPGPVTVTGGGNALTVTGNLDFTTAASYPYVALNFPWVNKGSMHKDFEWVWTPIDNYMNPSADAGLTRGGPGVVKVTNGAGGYGNGSMAKVLLGQGAHSLGSAGDAGEGHEVSIADRSGILPVVADADGKVALNGEVTGTLPVSSGGTGAVNAAAARTNLGLGIGADVQAYDADLADLADGSLTGSKVGSGISAANVTTGTLPAARLPGLSGDVTMSAGSATTTLSSTGVAAGTYSLATVTVDAKGRVTSASSGTANAPVQVDVFDGALLADDQTVTTTWTKPAGAKVIEVMMIGGGGAGGSGRQGGGSSVRCGGGGGAGGATVFIQLAPSSLISPIEVSYGGRRSGAASVTSAGNSGFAGSAGIDAKFGNYKASGGNGGNGGTAALASSVGGGSMVGSCLSFCVSYDNLAGGNGGTSALTTLASGNGLTPTGGGGII